MKTIAITIDEPTLTKVDNEAEKAGKNRSEFIREAVQAYVAFSEAEAEEEREREIFHRHRKKLKKQTAVLIREQAKI